MTTELARITAALLMSPERQVSHTATLQTEQSLPNPLTMRPFAPTAAVRACIHSESGFSERSLGIRRGVVFPNAVCIAKSPGGRREHLVLAPRELRGKS